MKRRQVKITVIVLCTALILIMGGCSQRIGPITFRVEVFNTTSVVVWFARIIPGAMVYPIGSGQWGNFLDIPKGTQVEFLDPMGNPIWIVGPDDFSITIHQDYLGFTGGFRVLGQGTFLDPYQIAIGIPVV